MSVYYITGIDGAFVAACDFLLFTRSKRAG